ncbi:phosphotransferase family protein [Nocardiopsis oceani]
MERAERLRHVCTAAGLTPLSPPTPVASDSNDVWLLDHARLGAVVLRIAWRGDLARMDRESAVARSLPESVPRPEVLENGHLDAHGVPLSYAVSRRLPGRPLSAAWPVLGAAERGSALRQYGEALRALHDWSPPAEVAELVTTRPGLTEGSLTALIGADILPLPVDRGLDLAELTRELPGADTGLLTEAVKAVEELRTLEPAVDDPARHGLVHGDGHMANLWWHGGALTLMDWEWVRFGPPSLDLQDMVDQADNDVLTGGGPYPEVLRGLAEHYPELFDVPRILDLLRLYSLLCALRQVAILRPAGAWSELPVTHSGRRLRRLLDGDWPAPGALPA